MFRYKNKKGHVEIIFRFESETFCLCKEYRQYFGPKLKINQIHFITKQKRFFTIFKPHAIQNIMFKHYLRNVLLLRTYVYLCVIWLKFKSLKIETILIL